jgi:hypothetical protein
MEQKQEKGCTQCKENLNGLQKGMVALSVYILITAIYGNVKLYQLIVSLF